jgi:hypothetical protein
MKPMNQYFNPFRNQPDVLTGFLPIADCLTHILPAIAEAL